VIVKISSETACATKLTHDTQTVLVYVCDVLQNSDIYMRYFTAISAILSSFP